MDPYLDIFSYDNTILREDACSKECHVPPAPFFNTAHYYIPYMEICLERMIAYIPYHAVCAMDMGKMCGLLQDYPGFHGALAGVLHLELWKASKGKGAKPRCPCRDVLNVKSVP